MNFADTHQRNNDYLAAQQLPLVPGGEVAGVREDTGERVVALSGTGGYAEYATAPEALTFPIPDGVDDGTALALLIQGLTAWHLYRTSGRVGPGRVGGDRRRRRRGGLARRPARQADGGRARDRAGLHAGQARPHPRAGRRRRDRLRPRGPEGAPDRGQRGQQVDVVFEMAGGAVFEPASPPWRRSAAW